MEWFSQGVPCYAFITWLVFHDRLYTGHSTRRWCQPQGCFFCGEPYETREHLFFACTYTFMLWLQVVRTLFGVEPDPDWDITISRLLTGKYDRLLLFCWDWSYKSPSISSGERGMIGSTRTLLILWIILVRIIDKTMRNRIMSTKYYLKPKLQGLLCHWLEAHLP